MLLRTLRMPTTNMLPLLFPDPCALSFSHGLSCLFTSIRAKHKMLLAGGMSTITCATGNDGALRLHLGAVHVFGVLTPTLRERGSHFWRSLKHELPQ